MANLKSDRSQYIFSVQLQGYTISSNGTMAGQTSINKAEVFEN